MESRNESIIEALFWRQGAIKVIAVTVVMTAFVGLLETILQMKSRRFDDRERRREWSRISSNPLK